MRKVHWGTPSKSDHYMVPRRTTPIILGGLAAGAAILALLVLGDSFGMSSPVSPGHVSSRHMIYDTRCAECHVSFAGASDVRCQRCHDPASAGRLTNQAHVFFGSLDPARSAAAPTVACASCHVEHKGTRALLTAVDEAHCVDCHGDSSELGKSAFSGFDDHVEFDALAEGQRQKAGILFSHFTHVTGTPEKIGYVLKDRQLSSPEQTCGECHRLRAGGSDFEAIRFDAHCNSCHGTDLKMDPVNAADVDSFQDLEFELDERTLREWGMRGSDFEALDGELQKITVAHKDMWIQHNRLKLWRVLDPSAFAAERAKLQGRKSRLERRLALASPTAIEDGDALAQRVATLESEIAYLDKRLAAQGEAEDPVLGLARLEQALAAVAAAGGTREPADEMVRQGAALGAQGVPPTPLSAGQFEERRSELLSVLDAIQKADPDRTAQVEELRRRLGQLTPGETSDALLKRARDQRTETLRRLRDEMQLRASGTAPPSETLMAAERQAISVALAEIQKLVACFDVIKDPEGVPSPALVERKQKTLAALVKGCSKCHEVSPLGAMPEARPAEPVLWRATFTHRDHLTQGETCASCHSGGEGKATWSVETSRDSGDLNFKGVDSCRECHTRGRVSDDCQKCHEYHPPAKP